MSIKRWFLLFLWSAAGVSLLCLGIWLVAQDGAVSDGAIICIQIGSYLVLTLNYPLFAGKCRSCGYWVWTGNKKRHYCPWCGKDRHDKSCHDRCTDNGELPVVVSLRRKNTGRYMINSGLLLAIIPFIILVIKRYFELKQFVILTGLLGISFVLMIAGSIIVNYGARCPLCKKHLITTKNAGYCQSCGGKISFR